MSEKSRRTKKGDEPESVNEENVGDNPLQEFAKALERIEIKRFEEEQRREEDAKKRRQEDEKRATNHFNWTDACEDAFSQLKHRLVSTPVLASPDFERPFVVQTDASDRGVGAVLSQEDSDGAEHPVMYLSRKLLPREQKYATVEKECLAVIWAVKSLRVYLLGKQFTVETDHRALQWLDKTKETSGRLTRWSLSLQPYSYQIRYRKGQANANADSLSRMYNKP